MMEERGAREYEDVEDWFFLFIMLVVVSYLVLDRMDLAHWRERMEVLGGKMDGEEALRCIPAAGGGGGGLVGFGGNTAGPAALACHPPPPLFFFFSCMFL